MSNYSSCSTFDDTVAVGIRFNSQNMLEHEVDTPLKLENKLQN